MTELNAIRENKTQKIKQASAKFLAFKAAFATSFGHRSNKWPPTSAAKWPLAPLRGDVVALQRGDVEKKEREARADFEEARSIWNETAKNFKWWQSLP